MEKWLIRRGDGDLRVSFRGKQGLTRLLRRDELIISKEEHLTEDHASVFSEQVVGRKAWRVNEAGGKFIGSKLIELNEGQITELAFLELLEIKFEGGQNG